MRNRFIYIILFLLFLIPVNSLQASEDGLICSDCHSGVDAALNHSDISCTECHKGYLDFPHENTQQADCLNCHSRHPEKTARDLHLNVACEACHMDGITPAKTLKNNKTVWEYKTLNREDPDPHKLVVPDDKICTRCHYKGNSLGASSRILPAKSMICMPCHASTFSVSDPLSIIAVVIFLIGISGAILIWISAGKSHGKGVRSGSSRVARIFNALCLDVLLQRRLFKASLRRWFIHAMILFPFTARFIWGLIALISSLTHAEGNTVWLMLDKNDPVTGFFFDITALLILLGGFLMMLEKRAVRRRTSIKGLPGGSAGIQILLGVIIITGFIAEGARIAMTGFPEGSRYAFIGYLVSRAFHKIQMNDIYIYIWYMHAVLTAAFFAFLPFSRMFHVLAAPVSMLIKGASEED